MNKYQEVCLVETVRSYSNLFGKKSSCCRRVLDEGKLLLSTGVGWRKVVVVDGCWMKKSCCCRRVLDEEKLLLSTGVGWRKVVVVDGCWMKSPGEIKFRLFRWWWWLFLLFWATVKVEYLHLDITDIANISSSLRKHMHHIVYLTLPPHIVNKLWISRENEKAVKIMTKT